MTILGIKGNTWGSYGPTLVGWTIFGLALAILMITLCKSYVDNRARGRIAEVAKLQAYRGAYAMIAPFAILLVDATVQEYRKGNISEQSANDITISLHESVIDLNENFLPLQRLQVLESLRDLLSHDTYLQNTSLNDTAPLKQSVRDYTPSEERKRTTWRDVFESYALKGIKILDSTLSSYGSVLSAEEVTVIQQFRNVWLTQRLENLSQVSESIRLTDFLRLHAQSKGEVGLSVYAEFLGGVHDVAQLCATQKKE